jgi:hypothetical protein
MDLGFCVKEGGKGTFCRPGVHIPLNNGEKKFYDLSCHGNYVYLSLWARMDLVASTFNMGGGQGHIL